MDALNYRPISPTSVPCKLMERVLYTNVVAHIDNQNSLFQNQCGFRNNPSCTTLMFQLITAIYYSIHAGKHTGVVFIGFG